MNVSILNEWKQEFNAKCSEEAKRQFSVFSVLSVFNKNLLSGLKKEKPQIMRIWRINIRGGCAFCGSKCEKERAKCTVCAV